MYTSLHARELSWTSMVRESSAVIAGGVVLLKHALFATLASFCTGERLFRLTKFAGLRSFKRESFVYRDIVRQSFNISGLANSWFDRWKAGSLMATEVIDPKPC
jgi:hypothetical protein